MSDTKSDRDLGIQWQFPDVTASQVAVGEYRVVFASDKSGEPGVPGDELHTNFKLGQNGEFLALVMTDGVTIVHEYAPEYPPQQTLSRNPFTQMGW